jgi:hypothetical protein
MLNILDRKAAELSEKLRADLAAIELDVATSYTLADAIREGGLVSKQARGWGTGETACALTSAVIAAKARDYV